MQYSGQVELLTKKFQADRQKMKNGNNTKTNNREHPPNPKKPSTELPAIPPAPATPNVALLLDVPS